MNPETIMQEALAVQIGQLVIANAGLDAQLQIAQAQLAEAQEALEAEGDEAEPEQPPLADEEVPYDPS